MKAGETVKTPTETEVTLLSHYVFGRILLLLSGHSAGFWLGGGWVVGMDGWMDGWMDLVFWNWFFGTVNSSQLFSFWVFTDFAVRVFNQLGGETYPTNFNRNSKKAVKSSAPTLHGTALLLTPYV